MARTLEQFVAARAGLTQGPEPCKPRLEKFVLLQMQHKHDLSTGFAALQYPGPGNGPRESPQPHATQGVPLSPEHRASAIRRLPCLARRRSARCSLPLTRRCPMPHACPPSRRPPRPGRPARSRMSRASQNGPGLRRRARVAFHVHRPGNQSRFTLPLNQTPHPRPGALAAAIATCAGDALRLQRGQTALPLPAVIAGSLPPMARPNLPPRGQIAPPPGHLDRGRFTAHLAGSETIPDDQTGPWPSVRHGRPNQLSRR